MGGAQGLIRLHRGARVLPTVNLGMAVGKGEAAAHLMQGGGTVDPFGGGGSGVQRHGKTGIVDTVLIFINKHPEPVR